MKIVLCGYNWIGCKVLSILLEKKHEVYVYTHKNPAHVNSLIDLCENLNVNYTTKKIDVNNLPFKPDIICSLYYRYIISQEIIELVNFKIFNLHPSLLPDYKGCSSITWAMINGEKKIGFTYHYINKGIDTGNIIFQKDVTIELWDTQLSLYQRIMYDASRFFIDVLDLVSSSFNGYPQVDKGNYYPRGCPHNGNIDLSWSDSKIERFIRAMNYPPLPYAKFEGVEVRSFNEFLSIRKKLNI